jgi:hypothetical protein
MKAIMDIRTWKKAEVVKLAMNPPGCNERSGLPQAPGERAAIAPWSK